MTDRQNLCGAPAGSMRDPQNLCGAQAGSMRDAENLCGAQAGPKPALKIDNSHSWPPIGLTLMPFKLPTKFDVFFPLTMLPLSSPPVACATPCTNCVASFTALVQTSRHNSGIVKRSFNHLAWLILLGVKRSLRATSQACLPHQAILPIFPAHY